MNASFAKLNRTLHWITSALGLASLVFFSMTGITLNHPDWFAAQRSVALLEAKVSSAWLADFSEADEAARLGLLAVELDDRWGLGLPRNIDHDEVEWVLDFQRPGGLGTVVLDLESGLLSYEEVSDGLVAVINDLHKGRHSGLVWSLLIDVTAVVCLLFGITGLVLLWLHASKRASTWPLVGLGTLLPLALYLWFVP